MTLNTKLPLMGWDAFDHFTGVHHGFLALDAGADPWKSVTRDDCSGWPFPPAHSGEQVHGAVVAAVEDPPTDDALLSPAARLPGVDALITQSAGVSIGVRSADCVPLLLVDPVTGTLGAVHAGWRGTAKWIAKRTVDAMGRHYGAQAENIYAVLGPSIGACCYEVRSDVVDAFERMGHPIGGFIKAVTPESWSLDVRGLNQHQLAESGVSALHMTSVGGCTSCDPAGYPSYRRSGPSENRIYAAIWREG